MAMYRVWAKAYYYIDVEAENEDEAKEIADDTDGGEFEAAQGWEIESADLINI